jgi:RimJ/RimL family protein N-acetyltransferase
VIHHGPREIADGIADRIVDDIRLREVTPEDAEALYRWRMEPATRGQFRGAAEVPYASHQAYLRRYFDPANSDRWFVIEAAGEPVGAIALYDLAPGGGEADGGEAEWGRFVIAPERRGRGWGRRSLELLIAHARDLGVSRLRCEVLAGNTVAAGLYRRLGFVETGSYEQEGRRFVQLAARLNEDL